MLTISIILGCKILMFVVESSNALELLKYRPRKEAKIPWAIPMSEYNCHLRETCTIGGPRACGWDELWGYLAYFKDICAMYRVNCEAKGRFSFVVQDNIVCRVKSQFVGKNKTVLEVDLPTAKTTMRTKGLRGVNRTTEWWWQGSTTDQYKYLQNMEVPP